MTGRWLMLVAASAALLSVPALAAAPINAPPAAFKQLLDCKAIVDNTARLACYDTQVASFGTAVDKQDIVIADRGQIRKARRSLFGLTLPSFDLFGAKDGVDKAEMTEITATISQVRFTAAKRWSFVLDDGARWVQSDTKDLPRDPKPGDTIKIRRAAMGSFLANIGGQIAIRVDRIN